MSSISALHNARGQAKTFGDRRGTRFLFRFCGKVSIRGDECERHERFDRDVGARLVNCSEVRSDNSECDDLYGEGCSIENERSHELSGGLALGLRNVGPARNA